MTRAERDLATGLLPDDGPTAAAWAVATMELGALVCMAASPRCAACPVARPVRVAARPATRRTTDRRGAARPTTAPTGSAAAGCSACSATATGRCTAAGSTRRGPVDEQRERCLQWLVDDGLVARVDAPTYALP